MKNAIILLFLTLLYNWSSAQTKGRVYTYEQGKKEGVPNVYVTAKHSFQKTSTDLEGNFSIVLNFPDTLVFTLSGYINDTLYIEKPLPDEKTIEVELQTEKKIEEVQVTGKKNDYGTLKTRTLNTESIGAGEIRKAACCNLSESFQTNTSVDINITDALSGAKKLQMMGIDGVYTQIQFENIPILKGLESSFGLNSIPGTWLESIQITKGTGSVVNGYETMAGLINLELKKPDKMELFFANGYVNHFGRSELNFDGKYKIREKISGAWFAHGSIFNQEIDQNKDNFRDLNLSKNLSLLNRWKYNGEKMIAQFGVNSYYEEKTGGQINYSPYQSNNLYGVHIETKHVDAFAKTGFLFPNRKSRSIGLISLAKWQETDALFGVRQFNGEEKRFYFNSIFEDQIKNPNHKIKTGFSFLYVDLTQKIDSISPVSKPFLEANRLEIVPGYYFEYSMTVKKSTHVIGNRIDYHSLFGLQVCPRLYGKVSLSEKLDVRYTAGRAFRSPNILMDNISLLGSSRNWYIDSTFLPESSWNFGGSLLYEFKFQASKNSISIDFYRTIFENQLIIDREVSYQEIYFKNVASQSFSNTLQVEVNLQSFKTLEWRLTYKFLDVKAPYNGRMVHQMMTQRHRWLTNLSYTSLNKKWEANITTVLNGKMRMKMIAKAYETKLIDRETEMYPTVNAQVTYIHKSWDFYIGGENLSNYQLKSVIVDAQNPFGSYFDATMVWAPTTGAIVYGGFRFKIKNSTKNKTL